MSGKQPPSTRQPVAGMVSCPVVKKLTTAKPEIPVAMSLAMPKPKADVLARRAAIAADLAAIVPGEGVVVAPGRAAPVRDGRPHRLPPDADAGRAAGDRRAGEPRPALLLRQRHPRRAARLRHLALRRRAAARGRRAARHVEVQPDPRHRLSTTAAWSCSRASPISASPTPSPIAASTTRPIPPRRSPARSAATSRRIRAACTA